MISSTDILTGLGLFATALTLHIIWWRRRVPSREMLCLCLIFLVGPEVVLLAAAACALAASPPSAVLLAFLIRSLFLISLSLIYIMTYPPIQAGCPSLKIILALAKAKPEGLSVREVYQLFPEDTMLSERFEDLINEGLVSWRYDSWGISAAGRGLATFFRLFRRILGMPLGEG